jgi:SAM-dependent methyltransferase
MGLQETRMSAQANYAAASPIEDARKQKIWSASGYCSRWAFIVDRCKGKSVLHLGFVGETDGPLHVKVDAFGDQRVLHPLLTRTASEVVGVDRDERAVEGIRSKFQADGLLVGDVEHLEQLPLDRTFDVILFGDLIEHLSCPGLALEGVRRFMSPRSELILSTPNAFALLANVRFTLGRFHEGNEHVAAYSKFTLPALLERHHLRMTELYTCFNRPPQSWTGRLKFSIGTPFFKAMPDRGGTLLAVARQIA